MNQTKGEEMNHFKVHILSDDGIEKAKKMQASFEILAESLTKRLGCQEGRELSIALTKLEEACFFAKKSMAMNKENQKK